MLKQNFRVLHAALSGHHIYTASDMHYSVWRNAARYTIYPFHSIITTKPLMQNSLSTLHTYENIFYDISEQK